LDLASTTAGRVGCPTSLQSLPTTTKHAATYWHYSISLISACSSSQSCSNSQRALSCQVPPDPPHLGFVRVSVCYFSRATTRKCALFGAIDQNLGRSMANVCCGLLQVYTLSWCVLFLHRQNECPSAIWTKLLLSTQVASTQAMTMAAQLGSASGTEHLHLDRMSPLTLSLLSLTSAYPRTSEHDPAQRVFTTFGRHLTETRT